MGKMFGYLICQDNFLRSPTMSEETPGQCCLDHIGQKLMSCRIENSKYWRGMIHDYSSDKSLARKIKIGKSGASWQKYLIP